MNNIIEPMINEIEKVFEVKHMIATKKEKDHIKEQIKKINKKLAP